MTSSLRPTSPGTWGFSTERRWWWQMPTCLLRALAYLADHCTAPLLVDPVSTVKAEKVRPILGKIHTLKPNRLEAELLSGVKITDQASARRAAQKLQPPP